MADQLPGFLAGVQWEPVEVPGDLTSGLPYATHTGVLELVGHRIRCHRLSDDRAVFNADDFGAFLVAWIDGCGRHDPDHVRALERLADAIDVDTHLRMLAHAARDGVE